MSEKLEAALSMFLDEKFNCAQSVLTVFCEKYGLDKKTALKISCGLGGGARHGALCGAVSGAVQVIGLKYGQTDASDTEAKKTCYAEAHEFIRRFREAHKSINCKELVDGNDIHGLFISDDEEKRNLIQDLHVNVCSKLLESAVKTLEEMGY